MAKIIFKSKVILLLIIFLASFLRLWKLSVNPVSLFGDELDLGYQAYSVLKTGQDYSGNILPVHFHSLAEWRTPLYLYSAVPTVAVFGISPLGVRLPAAIFGILSVLGMYLLVKELLSYGMPQVNKHPRALFAAFLMAISPWGLQYSRAGFEVTLLLVLTIFGLWLFIKSLNAGGKLLWLSVILLTLTPWVYSTAKFFTPMLLVFLFFTFRKEIFSFRRVDLIKASIVGLVIGLPIAYSTLFGGGSQRFNYISVFSDPTIEPEIGYSRQVDARMRGESGAGLTPTFLDRIVHNKFTYEGGKIIENYLQSFSTEFLFIKGDPNPRQSVGIGELYRIEIIALVFGIIFFFTEKLRDRKIKFLVVFWITAGALPAALTRDGGNHATRLILILPPLLILISYGWVELYKRISENLKPLLTFLIIAFYAIGISFYLHECYVHYPWKSERLWHAGWGESIKTIKSIDSNYDRVVISMSGEPAWIFFAGWYQYSPDLWHKEFPIGNDVEVAGFGKISHTGKFYFGSPSKEIGVYGLGKVVDSKTLYLANASEVGENLIMNPEKGPSDLKLIKAIPFPSGEPAFYLFIGTR